MSSWLSLKRKKEKDELKEEKQRYSSSLGSGLSHFSRLSRAVRIGVLSSLLIVEPLLLPISAEAQEVQKAKDFKKQSSNIVKVESMAKGGDMADKNIGPLAQKEKEKKDPKWIEAKNDINSFLTETNIEKLKKIMKKINDKRKNDEKYDAAYRDYYNNYFSKNKRSNDTFNAKWKKIETAIDEEQKGMVEEEKQKAEEKPSFKQKFDAGWFLKSFTISPSYEKFKNLSDKMKNNQFESAFNEAMKVWKKTAKDYEIEKFETYFKTYKDIDAQLSKITQQEIDEIRLYKYIDIKGKERELALDPNTIFDAIARKINNDPIDIEITLYDPKDANATFKEVSKKINNLVMKINPNIRFEEITTYPTYVDSLTRREYSLVISKRYSPISLYYETKQKAITELTNLANEAQIYPNRADLFSKFQNQYKATISAKKYYGFTDSELDKLDEIYNKTLGIQNAWMLITAYNEMKNDPYNSVFQKDFIKIYTQVTSGPFGPVSNKNYKEALSNYVKEQTGLDYPTLRSQYDSMLEIQSKIENYIDIARTNPQPGTKEYDDLKAYQDSLSQYDKALVNNLIAQKYNIKDLFAIYENIMKDDKFRAWRDDYNRKKDLPIEITNLRLETQYLFYTKIKDMLINKGAYNQETLQKLVNALKVVDPLAHNEYLMSTFPILYEKFPNDFDMITGLCSTYQAIVKNVPFERNKYENIRAFWQQTGSDIERLLSNNVMQLINDFKQLPEEEQLKIKSQLDQYKLFIQSLPIVDWKNVIIPYKYIDLINNTYSFSDIERMLGTQEVVRRQYPPSVVIGAIPYFSVVDILGETARQVMQKTYSEKPKFKEYNLQLIGGNLAGPTETMLKAGATGPESKIEIGGATKEGKLESGNVYVTGIRTPYVGNIETLNFDWNNDDSMNLYLNTVIPNNYNFVTTSFYNKDSRTYDTRNYIRLLNEKGESKWINIFGSKLTEEEAKKWYGRYFDGTTDIRGEQEGGHLAGFSIASQVYSSVATAVVHHKSSDAIGIIYENRKEEEGVIQKGTKVVAKILSLNEDPNNLNIREKEAAVQIIGKNVEIVAMRDINNTREAYTVKKIIDEKRYYDFTYYESLTDYIKSKAGSAYFKTPIGKSLAAWVLAKGMEVNGDATIGAITSLDIKGLGEFQISGSSEDKYKVGSLKFVGNTIGIEAAVKKDQDKTNSILNAEYSLWGSNIGAMYTEEKINKKYREQYGAGLTFPLGRWLLTARNALLDGYKWNSHRVGWLLGGQLYPHASTSLAIIQSGEIFEDKLLNERTENINFGVYGRRWPRGEWFVIVDNNRKTASLTDRDTLNKFGMKAGYTYYHVTENAIKSLTFTGAYENDIVNRNNILSVGITGERTTPTTSAGISLTISYMGSGGKKAKGFIGLYGNYSIKF